LHRAFLAVDTRAEAARCHHLAGLRRPSQRQRAVGRVLRRTRARRRPLLLPWLGLAGLAALLLLVIRPAASGPEAAATPFAVWQGAEGQRRELSGGESLTGTGELRLADGSRIALSDAQCLLVASPGHGLRLERGRYRVEATPQAPGRPLRLEGPLGSAEVVGTRFLVEAEAQRMRVAVESGLVAVADRQAGRWRLGPGEEVVLRAPQEQAFDTAGDWRVHGQEHLAWQAGAGEIRIPLRGAWRGCALWSPQRVPAGASARLLCQVRLPEAAPGQTWSLCLSASPDPERIETDDQEFEPIIHRRLIVRDGQAEFGYRFSSDDRDRRSLPLGPVPTGRWLALEFALEDGRMRASLDGQALGEAPLELPAGPLHLGLRASGRLQGSEAGELRIGLRGLRVMLP